MVRVCAVIGCSKRSNRDKGVRFFVIPTVVVHQGDRIRELTQRRRDLWLSRLHRENFKPTGNTRICSVHFREGITTLSIVIISNIYVLVLKLQANHVLSRMNAIQIGHHHSTLVVHQKWSHQHCQQ